jgi:hypothetical protein
MRAGILVTHTWTLLCVHIQLGLRFRDVRVDSQIPTALAVRELILAEISNDVAHFSWVSLPAPPIPALLKCAVETAEGLHRFRDNRFYVLRFGNVRPEEDCLGAAFLHHA